MQWLPVENLSSQVVANTIEELLVQQSLTDGFVEDSTVQVIQNIFPASKK